MKKTICKSNYKPKHVIPKYRNVIYVSFFITYTFQLITLEHGKQELSQN